ncbi:DNA topoisomerase [Neobacillus drentensis]|uniref:DNA topoisomerase n=1 Tax=Neobacillus drentensis TaxID=220684 RepID=UPI003000A460
MNIIYQREVEIENFKSQPYWDCYAEFKFGESRLIGRWFNNDSEHIFDHESAQALVSFCKESEAQIYSVINEEKKIRPPQLYNLSALQMEANPLYGMSPANVLAFAQGLYDKSFITYPRTDSKYLTPGEAKWLPTIYIRVVPG